MAQELYKRVSPHLQRVLVDGGTTTSDMNNLLLLQRSNEQYKDYLKLSFCPELHGYKKDTRSGMNYITKGYSNENLTTHNDLTQISSANQPYLDKIAPAEKLSAKNPNGGNSYLTHPTISFGASDSWTAEIVCNINGSIVTSISLAGIGYDGSMLELRINGDLYFNGFQILLLGNIKYLFGKTSNITLSIGNNILSTYINGLLFSTKSLLNNTFTFKTVMIKNGDRLQGNLFSHHIFSKALSASEVAERSAILRSIFPEIPFTRIGDQIWSVRNYEAICTPQGNLIPEMQANGNVEKMINTGILGTTDFIDSDSNGLADSMNTWNNATMSIVTGNGFTGNAQRAVLTGGWGGIVLSFSVKSNTRYKVSFKYRSSNVIVFGRGDGSNEGLFYNAPANTGNAIEVSFYTPYLTQYFVVGCMVFGAWIEIDNVSVQEVGWSDSQNLYTYIFNTRKTAGDTDEQATYAAVKAAAMWCHSNNDPALGAVYGKLYNWFAVKLLQMDIDYYNANNPTTPWGWRVPNQSDFNTLATTLGGASVAGGKMKMPGTAYWNSPNTGDNNSSGFSAIGGGRRHDDGYFFANNNQFLTHILDGDIWYEINYNSSSLKTYSISNLKSWGGSLRLIKT